MGAGIRDEWRVMARCRGRRVQRIYTCIHGVCVREYNELFLRPGFDAKNANDIRVRVYHIYTYGSSFTRRRLLTRTRLWFPCAVIMRFIYLSLCMTEDRALLSLSYPYHCFYADKFIRWRAGTIALEEEPARYRSRRTGALYTYTRL